MFSVYLNQLADSSARMQQIVRSWEGHIQEINQIINVLNSLSGMEEAVSHLREKKEALEAEEQQMIQMLQSLDKIRTLYDGSETKIVNNADGVLPIGRKIAYAVNKDVFKNKNIWTLPGIGN